METVDWRAHLQPDARERIVNKILDTLRRHLPCSGTEGINDLKKIALKFEEKNYTAAVDQQDYLRKISTKMLNMQTKSQNAPSNKPIHQANQSLPRQRFLAQNIKNTISSAVPGSANAPSSMQPLSGLSQNDISSLVGQNPSMESISGISQSRLGCSLEMGVSSNDFSSSQQQILGKQQPQTHNPQYLYQKQVQQLSNLKFQQQGNSTRSFEPSVQKLLQPKHPPSTQQITLQTKSHMQPSVMQSDTQSSVLPNKSSFSEQQSVNHQQFVPGHQKQSLQATDIHEHQTPMTQKHVISQQTRNTRTEENHLFGQQNGDGSVLQQQHRQPPKWPSEQQTNLPSLKQQSMEHQNNQLNVDQQHIESKTKYSELHPQQLHEIQCGSSAMQTNQHSVYSVSSLPATLGQQPQQMMPQVPLQSSHLQQDACLQQVTNPLGYMQQSLQVSSSLLQSQSQRDPQNQSQRDNSETLAGVASQDSTAKSRNTGGSHWQEEVYQKIIALKDMYLADVTEVHQFFYAKVQQDERAGSVVLKKSRIYLNMLQQILDFFSLPKNNIMPHHIERAKIFEKQILTLLPAIKKPLEKGHFSKSQVHSVPQSRSQTTRGQSHDNQGSPTLPEINIQGSLQTMQESSMTQKSVSSLSSGSIALPPNSSFDSGQSDERILLQEGPLECVQQSYAISSQKGNLNLQSSQLLKQTHQQSQMQQQSLQKQQLLKQHQRQQHTHQQSKQLRPARLQTVQMPLLQQMTDMNVSKMIQQQKLQKNSSAHQRLPYSLQLKGGTQFNISSSQNLQAPSSGLSQHSSTQAGHQNLPSSPRKNGTPFQCSPCGTTSSLPDAASTPGFSASPLLEFTSPNRSVLTTSPEKPCVTEQPFEHLVRVVSSMSPKELSSSLSDIGSVISILDQVAPSSDTATGSRASIGEELIAMTNCRLQAKNYATQDESTRPGINNMKRHISATSVNVVPTTNNKTESFTLSDLESTSSNKRLRVKVSHGLLEELRDINTRLINTVLSICDDDLTPSSADTEGDAGVIINCSFSAVGLSPDLRSHYASEETSQIQPIRLLVPSNYPTCSPILLDTLPIEIRKEDEDLSMKAKLRFWASLRTLSQPMSLVDIARIWGDCARAVITEYVQRIGGGTFSSNFGSWEEMSVA